jgi:S-formylglutathione hydrolase FrmB
MNALTGLDLLTGALPAVVYALAVTGALYLLIRRRRRWWTAVAAAVAAAVLMALGTAWFLTNVAAATAHELPWPVTAWIGVAYLAVVLAVLNMAGNGRRRKVLAPAATTALVLGAALQVNAYFGAFRSIDDLTGASTAGIAALPALERPTPGVLQQPASAQNPGPVAKAWVKPAGLPSAGTVNSVQIPGTVSGFASRTGYVYLPPAYQQAPSGPALPVLVLIPGQPGTPADWLRAGGLKTQMDAYAAAHDGLAPVVVVADVNGSESANTMCIDSMIARADTYVSVDVPAWIRATLHVDTDPARWAVGGFSFGGTCALQMAALHPDIYPSAIDFSGEAEPALGADRAATIRRAFGGDAAAFDALTPARVLSARHYAHSRIYLAVGGQDPTFSAYQTQSADAASGAGMNVKTELVPGVGHSWEVPRQALAQALDWLAPALGLSH